MLIGWLLFGSTLIFTFVILYYLYKVLLNISSKIISAIIFILIIPVYAVAMPLLTLIVFGYIMNFFDFKMNQSYWEIRQTLTVGSIVFLNACFGILLLIKLMLTHNKNEETNTSP